MWRMEWDYLGVTTLFNFAEAASAETGEAVEDEGDGRAAATFTQSARGAQTAAGRSLCFSTAASQKSWSVVMWRGIQKFYSRTSSDSVHHEGTVNSKHWKLCFSSAWRNKKRVWTSASFSVLLVWSKAIRHTSKLDWRFPVVLVHSREISWSLYLRRTSNLHNKPFSVTLWKNSSLGDNRVFSGRRLRWWRWWLNCLEPSQPLRVTSGFRRLRRRRRCWRR